MSLDHSRSESQNRLEKKPQEQQHQHLQPIQHHISHQLPHPQAMPATPILSTLQFYSSHTTPNSHYSNNQLYLPINGESNSSSLQEMNIVQNTLFSQSPNTSTNNVNSTVHFNNQFPSHYNESQQVSFTSHQPPLYLSIPLSTANTSTNTSANTSANTSTDTNTNTNININTNTNNNLILSQSSSLIPITSGNQQLNSVQNVSLSKLHQSLNELATNSLDIESLYNSANTDSNLNNNKTNDRLKDLLLHGYQSLWKIHTCYHSWMKSLDLNINDINDSTNDSQSVNSNNHVKSGHNKLKRRRLSPPLPLSSSSSFISDKKTKVETSPKVPISSRSKSLSNSNNANTIGLSILSRLSMNSLPTAHSIDSEKLKNETELGYDYNSNYSIYPSSYSHLVFDESLTSRKLNNINNTQNTQLNNLEKSIKSISSLTQTPISSSIISVSPISAPKTIAEVQYSSNCKTNTTSKNLPIDFTSLKCMHCLSTGTPEWRRGPDGERTLCNACGLFYSKLVKKYDSATAKNIMRERKRRGKCGDRRISMS